MTSSTPLAHLVVFGSLNMDLVLRVPRVPLDGETLQGHSIAYLPGGKGGNQAVSCARLGAKVIMIGQVGADGNGDQLLASLDADHIDRSGVLVDTSAPTGVALVMVDDAAQNRIVVIPGANGTFQSDAAQMAVHLQDAAMLVMQLEMPLQQVLGAVHLAHKMGCKVLLNPSPVQSLPDDIWPMIDTLVVNEVEAAAFTHIEADTPASAAQAAQMLLARGVRRVVVTLGAIGAVTAQAGNCHFHAALPVHAVDTTAAGDTFLGAVAVTLAQGGSLDEGAELGIRAASLCVQQLGAQTSIPTRSEVSRVASTLTWTPQ